VKLNKKLTYFSGPNPGTVNKIVAGNVTPDKKRRLDKGLSWFDSLTHKRKEKNFNTLIIYSNDLQMRIWISIQHKVLKRIEDLISSAQKSLLDPDPYY
jgi:hypothetical protein